MGVYGHGKGLPNQPENGEGHPSEAVLREMGRNTERLFREIQCRFHLEKDVEESNYPQIAAAEIIAVAAGRKPLYHELLLAEEAVLIADILRFILPETVTVACRDGHLIAYRVEQIRRILDSPYFYRPGGESDEKAIWRAVNSGAIGELLGYGLRNINDPNSVLVLIFEGEKVLAGFYAPKIDPIPFAKARAFDYSFYFQRDLEFIIRQQKTN